MAYVNVNPNPLGSYVGDCVIRALSIARNQSWSDTYIGVCIHGFMLCDMPSSNHVWGDLLKSEGYHSHLIPETCPTCYTIRDFCNDHPSGTYIVGTGSHVLSIIDGDYYDSWDSGDEHPTYYWTKEE